MHVVLRPELRTSGGESLGVFLSRRWVGDVYLVYREGHLLTGTIQLDAAKVSQDQVDAVVSHIQDYVAGLAGALDIEDATVVMMCGDIDPVLEGPETWPADRSQGREDLSVSGEEVSEEPEGGSSLRAESGRTVRGEPDRWDQEAKTAPVRSAPEDQDERYGDEGPEHESDGSGDEYRMRTVESPRSTGRAASEPGRANRRRRHGRRTSLHLSLYKEEGGHTKYHLHDGHHEPIGMVAVDELDNSVTGRVEFWRSPGKTMTNQVARLLAREFADGDVDRVSFTMNYRDRHLGDMHLEKRQLH
ncbi:MAG: hypothetical protein QJR01_07380 [Kyrpidia sp.]|nr:hypothetical protein [Kyrpidia sp.]